MRTWNEKIGKKIIEIIYSYEPKGMGFNQLVRQSGHAKKTIERWLTIFKNSKPAIVKILPKTPIHLTEYSINEIKKGNLAIPVDSRKKIKNNKAKRIVRSSNYCSVTIALVLCLATLGVDIYKIGIGLGSVGHRDPINQDKYYSYKTETNKGISIEDITFKFLNLKNNQPKKEASLPENKINMSNDELFGYIRLTKNNATKLLGDLVKHNPPILSPVENNKIDKITDSNTRYTIKDPFLEDFIKKCILAYNMDVSERLKYAYIFKLLTKSQILEYKKWMNKLYGKNRKITELFDYMDYERNKIKNKSPITVSSSKKYYLKYIQRCDEDIFNYSLFEKDIEKEKINGKCVYKLNICKKYKTIYERYPLVVTIFFDLLFPHFLREIWYCQIKSNSIV